MSEYSLHAKKGREEVKRQNSNFRKYIEVCTNISGIKKTPTIRIKP